MIVTRTPFRITLGGGGTDLPSFYQKHGGFIFATRGRVAYELPLHAQLAVGLQAGAGARWASGSAPGAGTTRTLLELVAVATWRVF